jgi:hypothetical protein
MFYMYEKITKSWLKKNFVSAQSITIDPSQVKQPLLYYPRQYVTIMFNMQTINVINARLDQTIVRKSNLLTNLEMSMRNSLSLA